MAVSYSTDRYASSRALMVWQQLAQRGIRDQRVLERMGEVPRERFLPEDLVDLAYADQAVSIGYRQTISQPYMVALTLDALALDSDHRVLEIGTGSGYVAALLSGLVREVVSVEIVPELAAAARERLRQLGCTNVAVIVADGSRGYPPRAPYDRIAVAAAAPAVPASLVDQLDGAGAIVLPVGDRHHQMLRLLRQSRTGIEEEDLCPCIYVPLVGDEGWGTQECESNDPEENPSEPQGGSTT